MSIKSHYSRKIAAITFLLVFGMQIIFNLYIKCMRSLPDELGASALAAELAGYDWSYVLSHPSKYYGSANFWILYPIYALIKNPMTRYQAMLAVGALFRSLTAYISCRICQKYLLCKNMLNILLIGIAASFFTPTRSSNIDNEPLLILECWVIVYLLLSLQKSELKKKRVLSILLAFVLGLSYLSHTRAIIYTISFIFVFVLYIILTRKTLVSVVPFMGGMVFSFGISIFFSNQLRDRLFVSRDTLAVSNTAQEAVTSVAENLKNIFSKTGFCSLLDLLTGNIWVIFIFGCGVITITTIFALINIFVAFRDRFHVKTAIQLDDIFIPAIFCIAGLGISLVGVAIKWLPEGIAAHELKESISRGHFYLRYYGNYFGPCLLWFIYYFMFRREKKYRKLSLCLTSCLTFISIFYFTFSILLKNTRVFTKNTDWFYYFAPFSLSNGRWPNIKQDLSYYFSATIVVVFICTMLYIFIIKKYFRPVYYLLGIVLIWQYTFGVLQFDRPYSESSNYYQAANGVYELSLQCPELFEEYNKLYYYNETYGPEYIVQFLIPNKLVITDLELLEKDDANLILTTNRFEDKDLNKTYWYVKLDENEFLYFNLPTTKKILEAEGYSVWKTN